MLIICAKLNLTCANKAVVSGEESQELKRCEEKVVESVRGPAEDGRRRRSEAVGELLEFRTGLRKRKHVTIGIRTLKTICRKLIFSVKDVGKPLCVEDVMPGKLLLTDVSTFPRFGFIPLKSPCFLMNVKCVNVNVS